MSESQATFVIESLRAGIPTRVSTRLLPELRPSITDRIVSDLTGFGKGTVPPGRLIWGQYGQGKTHALTAIEHLALDRNFAVSRVSLSREVTCRNLFQLYGNLAPRIRTPDSTLEGIQQYLNRIQPLEIRQSALFEEGRYANSLPVQVLEDYFYAEGEDKDGLYGDLLGVRLPAGELSRIHRTARGSVIPKFKFKVAEHAESYFGMMADAIQLCGFEGWVILLDEVELLGRLGKLSRFKAYQNLNWLLNWQGGMEYPIYTVAAAATRLQDDLWYGGKGDDRASMPELARERAGAQAQEDMERFFTRAIDKDSLKVLPADPADLERLLDRIVELHGKAYEWNPDGSSPNLIRHLGAQPVRTYVRAALEYLDLQYLYGRTELPDLAALVETSVGETEGDEPTDAVSLSVDA
jgi:hypothetical protein